MKQKLLYFFRNTSLRNKLMAAFAALLALVGGAITAGASRVLAGVLRQKNETYVREIVYQTTNNVEFLLRDIDELTVNVLVHPTVQEVLGTVRRRAPTAYEINRLRARMEEVLYQFALMNDDIVSLSVFSSSGLEFSAKRNVLDETQRVFAPEAVYAANGTALWGIAGGEGRDLCCARAILDVRTMKPLGYVSVVFRQAYIGNVVRDISPAYSTTVLVVGEGGRVVSSNREGLAGRQIEALAGPGPAGYWRAWFGGAPYFAYRGEQMKSGWALVMMIPENEFAAELRRGAVLIAVLAVLVYLAAMGLIVLLTGLLTRPVIRLCRLMESAGRGNFKVRSDIDTRDEIGLLSHAFNRMLYNIDTLIEKIYKLEIAQKQAELEFLKMQINPHFLYNTLETINWMARINEMDDIGEVTTALGSLLRAMVKQSSLVTVREEINNIKNYVLIQQYRFGDKVAFSFSVDAGVEGTVIPSFLLQPLVENAIIHGLEPKRTKGRVEVVVHREGEQICFFVSDDGVGMAPQALARLRREFDAPGEDRTFIGLKNVDRRLQIYYGPACRLRVESRQGQGTRVGFCLPAGASPRERGQPAAAPE